MKEKGEGGGIHVRFCVAPRLSVTANTFLEKIRNSETTAKASAETAPPALIEWFMPMKASEVWGKHCYCRCYYATVDHSSALRNNKVVSTSNVFIAVYLCMNMHYNSTAASDTLQPENENAWHSKPSHRRRETLCLELLME